MIDKFYMVDIYIPSKKLCIEIQGPTHYAIKSKLTKKTAVKAKLLKMLGYNVRHIDAMKVLRTKTMHRSSKNDKSLSMVKNMLTFMSRS